MSLRVSHGHGNEALRLPRQGVIAGSSLAWAGEKVGCEFTNEAKQQQRNNSRYSEAGELRECAS